MKETKFFRFSVVGLILWLLISLMTVYSGLGLLHLIWWFCTSALVLLLLSLYATWTLGKRWWYGAIFSGFAIAMVVTLNLPNFLAFDIAFIPLDSENMVFTYETWFLWALGGILALHFFLTFFAARALYSAKAKLMLWLIAIAWVVQSSYTAFFTIVIIAIAHAFR